MGSINVGEMRRHVPGKQAATVIRGCALENKQTSTVCDPSKALFKGGCIAFVRVLQAAAICVDHLSSPNLCPLSYNPVLCPTCCSMSCAGPSWTHVPPTSPSLCRMPYLLFDVLCRTIMDTCAYDAQVRQFLDPSTVVLVGHR